MNKTLNIICTLFILITGIPKLTPQQIYIAHKYEQELQNSSQQRIEQIEYVGDVNKAGPIDWSLQWLEIKPYVINHSIDSLDNFNKDIENVRNVLDDNQDLLKLR